MSITNTNLEVAIEIDCTDTITATLESVGLYGGYFRFVTGNVVNYDSKTWASTLIKGDSMNPASRSVDLSETGGYSPEGNFGFSIAGSTDLIDYIDSFGILMVGRTVRVWSAINGTLVPTWCGVVDTYGETEDGCDIACVIEYKSRHKTIPPNVTTNGNVIPVVFGKVSKSPTIQKTGLSEPFFALPKPVLEKVDSANFTVKLKIELTFSESIKIGLALAVGTTIYFRFSGGSFVDSYMSNDTLYEIDSVEIVPLAPTGQYYINTTAVISNMDSTNYPSSATNYQTVWTLSFFIFDAVHIASNGAVTFNESQYNLPALSKYVDQNYVDISNNVNSVTGSEISITGFQSSASVKKTSAFSLDITDAGLFDSGGPRDILNPAAFAGYGYITAPIFGNISALSNRSGANYYGYTIIIGPNSQVFNEYVQSAMNLGKLTKDMLIDGVDEYYISLAHGLDQATTSGGITIDDQNVRLRIYADTGYSAPYHFMEQDADMTGLWRSAEPVFNYMPESYFVDVAPGFLQFPRVTTDLKSKFLIPSDLIRDLRSGILTSLTFVHQYAGLLVAQLAAGSEGDIYVSYWESGIVPVSQIEIDDTIYYCDIAVGDSASSTIPDAIDVMITTYDGIASYESADVVANRTSWAVGRTLIERKSSADYIDELCRNAFMAGFIDVDGVLTFRTWIDNVTPVYTFNDGNIIRGSISDWNLSPLSDIYNDLSASCGYDYGADDFKDFYKITNIDAASFPLESETWQTYVVGQSDYATAKAAWETAKYGATATGMIQKLPSSIGELPWFRREALGAGSTDSAWEFITLCAYWLSNQKASCKLSAPITTSTLVLKLCDPVNVSDYIYTNGSNIIGWITGIDVDYESRNIDFAIQFAPVAATGGAIYRETGTAPNIIRESGIQTTIIRES